MSFGGKTQAVTVAPTPAMDTRSSTEVQSLAAQQSKRYANPNSFTNSVLSYGGSNSFGNSTGAGSSTLGG